MSGVDFSLLTSPRKRQRTEAAKLVLKDLENSGIPNKFSQQKWIDLLKCKIHLVYIEGKIDFPSFFPTLLSYFQSLSSKSSIFFNLSSELSESESFQKNPSRLTSALENLVKIFISNDSSHEFSKVSVKIFKNSAKTNPVFLGFLISAYVNNCTDNFGILEPIVEVFSSTRSSKILELIYEKLFLALADKKSKKLVSWANGLSKL